MDYKLVFDLQTAKIPLTDFVLIIPGFCIFAAGVVALIRKKRLTNPFRKRPPMPERLPVWLMVIGALWIQFSGLLMYTQYHYLDNAITTGKVTVAEGKVVHFTPASLTSKEQFCLSDSEACFSYADYTANPGFHHTQNKGGPIKSGLPVRVTYKGDAYGSNTIVKLEVASEKSLMTRTGSTLQSPPEAALSPAR